jgi:hypothetical protein
MLHDGQVSTAVEVPARRPLQGGRHGVTGTQATQNSCEAAGSLTFVTTSPLVMGRPVVLFFTVVVSALVSAPNACAHRASFVREGAHDGLNACQAAW